MIGIRFRAESERFRLRPAALAPLLVAIVAAQTPLVGCARDSRIVVTGHPVHARGIAQLTIGRSTPADVQSLLGRPDELDPDGSLIYRATAVRHRDRSLAGFAWSGADEVVERRLARFRFAQGVLTQICRERS